MYSSKFINWLIEWCDFNGMSTRLALFYALKLGKHVNCTLILKYSIPLISFFIIKGFRSIVFIFIVISTKFRPISPPAFFRCLSNSGTFTELWTTSFIESTGAPCSDSISHNRVQVLSILVFLLTCKGRSSKFHEGSRVRQTPEEGRKAYRPKRIGNNNKDKDNSPKALYDKNQQASSLNSNLLNSA